ncbi:glycosyltransferase family 4 protein [Paenibacillus paeoniae]|uniref:Glycosyltransferase family 1 protein n=1 Tax=Paenibacillus paeoniae TaxID=2292705 RepID=A0A371PIV2_9BACL|nr:glycosyltransferase family 1 protein [Paenibacillus paeoniae]REK75717.1 glycosyltransferase family 1 protein [Paenibacillus paeoniae]
MRIAIFTDTYVPDVNGVARTLSRWTGYLERTGVSSKLFAPEPSASDHPNLRTHSVERFASLPFFLYPECRLALPNPAYIRGALTRFQPDLIHVATPFNLGLYGIHYARKYNIPLIASYHTNFDQYLSFYHLQWMEKLLWRYMDWFHRDCKAIFVPSETTREQLAARSWEESRLKVWSRGVDQATFHPLVNRREHRGRNGIGEDAFLAFYAGRLAPEKDIETAIDAFSLFQGTVAPDAVFVIAGDGPSAQALKDRCAAKGVNAKFIGFADAGELQRWYASADVLLFPSPTETFGNVALEAMACGTPVLAANAGGVRDTVRDGENGLLRKQGDVGSFAEALEMLHGNADLRERMGRNAHAYSLSQSWDRIFDSLFASCTAIVAASGRGVPPIRERQIN